jgi:hypothetical protein
MHTSGSRGLQHIVTSWTLLMLRSVCTMPSSMAGYLLQWTPSSSTPRHAACFLDAPKYQPSETASLAHDRYLSTASCISLRLPPFLASCCSPPSTS